MKRTITIILMTFLIVSSTLVFVACSGGVKTEKQWNDAMDYMKNCDKLTITYEQNKSTNGRIYKTNHTWAIDYDLTNGMLYAEENIKTYNILGSLTDQSRQCQYVEVKGTELRNYTKNAVNNQSENWEANIKTYNSEEECFQQLQQVFWAYLKQLNLDNFNYNDFTLRFGKYAKSEVINQKNNIWKVTFSGGKLSEVNFETKHVKGSSDIDTNKINITLTYSASITAPDGLENATWK